MSEFTKAVLLVGGLIFALTVVVALTNSGKKDGDASPVRSSSLSSVELPSITAAKPSGPAVAPAGSSVRDGKFEFRVLGVERAASKAGIFSPEQAKGEFLVVKLRVTNIGDEARTYFADNQKLIINGNKYEASSSLGDDSFSEEINPGLGIDTEAVFDIPPGAVPDAIVCHDSAFSGGAHLAL